MSNILEKNGVVDFSAVFGLAQSLIFQRRNGADTSRASIFGQNYFCQCSW